MNRILILLLLIIPVSVYALEDHEKNYTPIGCAQDTDMATAQALPSIPTGAVWARWQATGADIRWRDDGIAPTATVGVEQVAGGQYQMFYNGILAEVLIIEETTTSVFDICYYK